MCCTPLPPPPSHHPQRRLLIEIGALVKLRDTFSGAYFPSHQIGGSPAPAPVPVPAATAFATPILSRTQPVGALSTPAADAAIKSGVSGMSGLTPPSAAALELLLSPSTQSTLAYAKRFYEETIARTGTDFYADPKPNHSQTAHITPAPTPPAGGDKQPEIEIKVSPPPTDPLPVPVSVPVSVPVPPTATAHVAPSPGRVTKGVPHPALAIIHSTKSVIDSGADATRQLNFTTPPRIGAARSTASPPVPVGTAPAAAFASEPVVAEQQPSSGAGSGRSLSLFERAKRQRERELEALIAARKPIAASTEHNGWMTERETEATNQDVRSTALVAADSANSDLDDSESQPVPSVYPPRKPRSAAIDAVAAPVSVLAPPPVVKRSRDWSVTVNALSSGGGTDSDSVSARSDSTFEGPVTPTPTAAASAAAPQSQSDDESGVSYDGFGSMRFTPATAVIPTVAAVFESEPQNSSIDIELEVTEVADADAPLSQTAPLSVIAAPPVSSLIPGPTDPASTEDDDRSIDGESDEISRAIALPRRNYTTRVRTVVTASVSPARNGSGQQLRSGRTTGSIRPSPAKQQRTGSAKSSPARTDNRSGNRRHSITKQQSPTKRRSGPAAAAPTEYDESRTENENESGDDSGDENSESVAAAVNAAVAEREDDQRRINSMKRVPKTRREQMLEAAAREAIASFSGASLDALQQNARDLDTNKQNTRFYRTPTHNTHYPKHASASPAAPPPPNASPAVTAVTAVYGSLSPVRSVARDQQQLLVSPQINQTAFERAHELDRSDHHARPQPLKRRSHGPSGAVQPVHTPDTHAHLHATPHTHGHVNSPHSHSHSHSHTQPISRSPIKSISARRSSAGNGGGGGGGGGGSGNGSHTARGPVSAAATLNSIVSATLNR